jgi:flagellar basal-body rod protein FlgG
MSKGIYIALSGAILKQKHMDIFAQNIANAATTGYKKERMSFKNIMIPVDNKQNPVTDGRSMTEISSIITDFSSGTLLRTSNPLDLAINGEGFFVLDGDRYTRNGNFKISRDGYLATQGDIKVLGSGGPISVQGSKIDINTSGEVYVDDIAVGTIKTVEFPDKSNLKKLDGGVFTTNETGEAAETYISQGYLETSNVEVVKEMVHMLTSLREFEAYQKMIQAFDEASGKTIDQMGR